MAAAKLQEYPRVLDASVLPDEARRLQEKLLSKIIGQDRAVKQFVKVYSQFQAGLGKSGRPIGVFLFLGPTGTGKTELVLRSAEALLGKKEALIRIDCAEFQHSHEISKIIGSPPGYLGHRETHPLITKERLEQYWTEKIKLSFLLFDEIEKSSDALWQLLLGITDNATLTLGDNRTVDLSQTIIVMTANLGSKDVSKYLQGTNIGFTDNEDTKSDDIVYKLALKAAKHKFQPEFMNRIDRVVVFRSLSQDSLRKILALELWELQFRIQQSNWKNFKIGESTGPIPMPLLIQFATTESANDFLLKEGTSKIYGARELNRAIDRFLTFPLGNLLVSKQIVHGDVLEIDYKSGKDLIFTIVGHRDLEPLPTLEPGDRLPPANTGPTNDSLKEKVVEPLAETTMKLPKRVPAKGWFK